MELSNKKNHGTCEHDTAGPWLHYTNEGYIPPSIVPSAEPDKTVFLTTLNVLGGNHSCSKCGTPFIL